MANDLHLLIRSRAERAGAHPYLLDGTGAREVSWQALSDAADAWCGYSQRLPAGPVALSTADPLTTATALLGLLVAGRVVAPVDPAAPAAATAALLHRIEPVAVVDDALSAAVHADSSPPACPGSTGGAILLFSSGSTGARKAVQLDAPALLHAARSVVAAHRLTPVDRGLCPLPLHHVNAEVVGVLATLLSGGSLVLPGRFSRRDFWRTAAEQAVTWLNLVPAIIALLIDAPGPRPAGVRFARSASAPLPVAVAARFEETTGIPVVESYGMTEAAGPVTVNPADGRKLGSVGRPVGVELRVRRASGGTCRPGEIGRVEIRGPSVIRGYADGAAANRFHPTGWLDTGDLGYLDEDGFLFLNAREGEVINSGGEKVFPREVEEVLRREPAVTAAAVIARPDPVRGEVPVAYVEAEKQSAGLVQRLIDRCVRDLPRHARPAQVLVVDALPTGATGKLSRSALVGWDRHRAEPVTVR